MKALSVTDFDVFWLLVNRGLNELVRVFVSLVCFEGTRVLYQLVRWIVNVYVSEHAHKRTLQAAVHIGIDDVLDQFLSRIPPLKVLLAVLVSTVAEVCLERYLGKHEVYLALVQLKVELVASDRFLLQVSYRIRMSHLRDYDQVLVAESWGLNAEMALLKVNAV